MLAAAAPRLHLQMTRLPLPISHLRKTKARPLEVAFEQPLRQANPYDEDTRIRMHRRGAKKGR